MEFIFMKECLQKYNYPNIHSLSDVQVADVFKPSNRCFLISWLLKLLDDSYESVLQNTYDEVILGNLINEHGFCTLKDKTPFMKGELPITKQVNILYKIFKFIRTVKDQSKSTNNSTETFSVDQIKNLSNTNLNMFPNYGPLKLLTRDQTIDKIEEYKKEIEELQLLINSNETKENCDTTNSNPNIKDQLKTKVQKLSIDMQDIKKAIETIVKFKNTNSEAPYKLDDNCERILQTCNEHILLISQFIKDINTIKEFDKIKDWGFKSGMDCDIFDMIKELAKESVEVANL